jgi:hypothetical protein
LISSSVARPNRALGRVVLQKLDVNHELATHSRTPNSPTDAPKIDHSARARIESHLESAVESCPVIDKNAPATVDAPNISEAAIFQQALALRARDRSTVIETRADVDVDGYSLRWLDGRERRKHAHRKTDGSDQQFFHVVTDQRHWTKNIRPYAKLCCQGMAPTPWDVRAAYI